MIASDRCTFSRPFCWLYAQCHDTVDDVVVILLERLDGLLSAYAGLGHDKLNILSLETSVVNLLPVILLLLSWFAGALLNGLPLVSAVGGVVVRGLVGGLRGELLGGGSLSLNVEVLNFGLAEDAVPGLAFSCAILCFNSSYIQVLLLGDL